MFWCLKIFGVFPTGAREACHSASVQARPPRQHCKPPGGQPKQMLAERGQGGFGGATQNYADVRLRTYVRRFVRTGLSTYTHIRYVRAMFVTGVRAYVRTPVHHRRTYIRTYVRSISTEISTTALSRIQRLRSKGRARGRSWSWVPNLSGSRSGERPGNPSRDQSGNRSGARAGCLAGRRAGDRRDTEW